MFMQDGAPPHYKRNVQDALNIPFPNGWIGRGGHNSWLARSTDPSTNELFFWGYIKTIMYTIKIVT